MDSDSLAPLLPALLEKLIKLFSDPEAERMSETIAVGLCRIALHAPQPVAQEIGSRQLIHPLIVSLRNLQQDDVEKAFVPIMI